MYIFLYTESWRWPGIRGNRQATLPSAAFVLPTQPLCSKIPAAITVVDDESDPLEQRFVTLGADAAGRILVVVYTWCADDIRLISARCAEPHEREEYEKQ